MTTETKKDEIDDIAELAEYSDEEEAAAGAEQKQHTTAAKEPSREVRVGSHTMNMSTFRDLLLKPEIQRAIVDCGFEHPSEVQHKAIPQALLGTDVLCQAKSGMGKTAVFVISILQQDVDLKHTSALVLCHTRELAQQIRDEFERFSKYLPAIRTVVFYGGIPVAEHREMLRGRDSFPHIAIGTPGRVRQLANEGHLVLENLRHFVLDECDKMLEQLDMRGDVQDIFKLTPRDKQVMMFSATMPEEIRAVCKKFMHNPLEIFIDDGSKLTLEGMQQYYVQMKEEEKNRKLVDLLDALEFNQTIVFVRSTARAEALAKLLCDCNFPAICMHSAMPQPQRIERYRSFKDFKSRIMVATNLFGRGIDIPRVNVVFNYDMCEDPDSYLHRVGRAGRFGTKGLAISFISSKTEGDTLNSVQKRFVVEVPELPDEIDTASYMGS